MALHFNSREVQEKIEDMVKPKKSRSKKNIASPNECIASSIQDPEEDEATCLPGQEHCEWLLNVIRTQATKVAEELLSEERRKSNESIKSLKEEISSLQSEVKQCKDANLNLEKEIAKLKYAKNGINNDLSRQKSSISALKLTVDQMDQKQRETRIKIAGIQESEEENLEKTLMKYAKNTLGVKLKSADIEQIYRVGKKKVNKKRDIAVQFSTKKVRDTVFENRKRDTTADAKNRIYVNDDLTIYRQKLLFDARQLVKRKKLKGAWTQNGNVIILKQEGGPIPVMSHDDLRETLNRTDLHFPDETTNDELSVETLSDVDSISMTS